MTCFGAWYNNRHMDTSQKEEVKALRGLLSRMDRGGKCIPCRIVFFFSLIVFIGVVVFLLIAQVRTQSVLTPVPPELTVQLTPEQYSQELLRLEAVFKDHNSPLLYGNPMSPSSATSSSLPVQHQ